MNTYRRHFRRRRLFDITPEAYETAIEILAEATIRWAPEAIVAIAAGGSRPARDLANRLDADLLWEVSAQHNPCHETFCDPTGAVAVDGTPPVELAQRARWLLVDDICGSGATYHAVAAHLYPRAGPGVTIRFVTLCRNEGAVVEPDWWVWSVDDWVRFPWEPKLPVHGITIQHLTPPARPIQARSNRPGTPPEA